MIRTTADWYPPIRINSLVINVYQRLLERTCRILDDQAEEAEDPHSLAAQHAEREAAVLAGTWLIQVWHARLQRASPPRV